MKHADMLAFAAASMGGVVALLAVFRERRSIPKWCFVTGMMLFSLESIANGLGAHSDQGSEAIKYWQQWRLVVMALLPGTWLLFSLSYARGNYHEFLFRWRCLLIIAFILPTALAWFFYEDLIKVKLLAIQPNVWLFRLTTAGLVLYGALLIAAVLVLVNLERTFRASVGTMRWRIKFMILGIGVLFAVRVYTSSQALLWPRRGIDELLLEMDSVGLILGHCCARRLMWRCTRLSPCSRIR